MNTVALRVSHLRVEYRGVGAVRDVSFDIEEGETVALVGESGSGKSTLARAILRLIPVAGGEVVWRGRDLLACDAEELRTQRRAMQIVFQDPLASLNPRMTVREILAEPFKIFEPGLRASARDALIEEMLERVGLGTEAASRYPHEFSGGQCQRIGIARAMMLRPKLLICDEPVSSLDVSIRGQIINLLADLQREFRTSMLFISHDLAVVRHLSHRVLVLYGGKLVEVADCESLFAAPVHPYTRALLSAVPDPFRAPAAATTPRLGDVPRQFATPSPGDRSRPDLPPGLHGLVDEEAAVRNPRTGCSYLGRCAYGQIACARSVPPLVQIAAQHLVACHRWRDLAARRT